MYTYNEYIQTLKLQEQLNQINFDKNRDFMKTGVQDGQPVLTRSLEERYADVEKLKIEARSMLNELTDPENATITLNYLINDNELLILFLDTFPSLKKVKETEYAGGMFSAQIISWLTSYKNDRTDALDINKMDVQFSVDQAVSREQLTKLKRLVSSTPYKDTTPTLIPTINRVLQIIPTPQRIERIENPQIIENLVTGLNELPLREQVDNIISNMISYIESNEPDINLTDSLTSLDANLNRVVELITRPKIEGIQQTKPLLQETITSKEQIIKPKIEGIQQTREQLEEMISNEELLLKPKIEGIQQTREQLEEMIIHEEEILRDFAEEQRAEEVKKTMKKTVPNIIEQTINEYIELIIEEEQKLNRIDFETKAIAEKQRLALEAKEAKRLEDLRIQQEAQIVAERVAQIEAETTRLAEEKRVADERRAIALQKTEEVRRLTREAKEKKRLEDAELLRIETEKALESQRLEEASRPLTLTEMPVAEVINTIPQLSFREKMALLTDNNIPLTNEERYGLWGVRQVPIMMRKGITVEFKPITELTPENQDDYEFNDFVKYQLKQLGLSKVKGLASSNRRQIDIITSKSEQEKIQNNKELVMANAELEKQNKEIEKLDISAQTNLEKEETKTEDEIKFENMLKDESGKRNAFFISTADPNKVSYLTKRVELEQLKREVNKSQIRSNLLVYKYNILSKLPLKVRPPRDKLTSMLDEINGRKAVLVAERSELKDATDIINNQENTAIYQKIVSDINAVKQAKIDGIKKQKDDAEELLNDLNNFPERSNYKTQMSDKYLKAKQTTFLFGLLGGPTENEQEFKDRMQKEYDNAIKKYDQDEIQNITNKNYYIKMINDFNTNLYELTGEKSKVLSLLEVPKYEAPKQKEPEPKKRKPETEKFSLKDISPAPAPAPAPAPKNFRLEAQDIKPKPKELTAQELLREAIQEEEEANKKRKEKRELENAKWLEDQKRIAKIEGDKIIADAEARAEASRKAEAEAEASRKASLKADKAEMPMHVSNYARQEKNKPVLLEKYAEINYLTEKAERRIIDENFQTTNRLKPAIKDNALRNGGIISLVSQSGKDNKLSQMDEVAEIGNPQTGRMIGFNSSTHKKLIKDGLMPPLI